MGFLVAVIEENDGSCTMICDELNIRVTERTTEEAQQKMSKLIDKAVGIDSTE